MTGRRPLLNTAAGSGKSSLLYRALDRARREGRPVLRLGARPVRGSRELIDALLELAAEEGWVAETVPPDAAVALAEEDRPTGRYDPVRQSQALRRAEEVAGRPGAMLVAELWGRDGVSASDLELQHTLGVTRSRLTELLRTLAAHGVLASYPEPRETPGRPRMIYSIREP